jgi:hypothetical protein
MISLSRRHRLLLQFAPISEEREVRDRHMRVALHRARKDEGFGAQQNFDRAVAALVRDIPIPQEIRDWVPSETLIAAPKRPWKRYAQHPAILATATAVAVIAGVFAFHVVDNLNDFPNEDIARKLLEVAASTRSVLLDPVKTNAGELGDFFFMKYRLEHYDVPPEFADFRTLGYRVFPDEEAQRVAQIWTSEKRVQFFIFPSKKDPKTGAPKEFPGWRYVDHEGWTGVVQEHNGICFMAAIRGREKDLAPYIAKKTE